MLSVRTAVSVSFILAVPSYVVAQTPPVVGSGALVAHFRADATTVATDPQGNVISWTAANNNAIILNGTGTPLSNIRFNPTGMSGKPTVEVHDFTGQDRVLSGSIAGTRTATTIIWLGYFSPTRNGALGDGSGQYIYCYGADGPDGSQLDMQIDNNNVEVFGGSGTQLGDPINQWNYQYSVWRAYYGTGTGNGQAIFVNRINLNLPPTITANFNVTGNLMLFGFQNSTGASGGFNFVGNLSSLLIYDGILNAADTLAIENFLACQAYDFDCNSNLLNDVCETHPCPSCPGDVNADNWIDGRDVDAFVDLLLSASPSTCGDMNQSGGVVDQVDLMLFICSMLGGARPCV